jgi:hypothetical protein
LKFVGENPSESEVQVRDKRSSRRHGFCFDHDFGYSFHLLYSLLKRRGEEKENE